MSSHACWSAGGRNAPAATMSRRSPPSWACTLRNSQRLRRVGEPPGDPPRPLEGRRLALLLHLALDRAPEHVDDLRDEEHGGDAVVAQAVEDDPRVSAAEVEDVRPDIHPVEQRDLLLQAVREREQRDQPVLHRLEDPVEGHRAGQRVAVRKHHALRASGGARREHELVDLVRPRAVPGPDLGQPVPRECLVRLLGQAVDGRRREPLEADLPRIGCVTPGSQQETHGTRGRDDVRDGVGAHAGVQRDVDQARDHRAEVGRRQRGC